MRQNQPLAQLIRGMVDKDPDTIVAEVWAVNGATCDVKPVDGSADIYDVRLQAVAQDEQNGWLLVPTIGSLVLVTAINGDSAAAAVLLTTEIERIQLVIGEVQLEVDQTGFKFTRGSESLAALLTDLLTAIEQLTFSNGGGVTNPPINLPQIQAIKARIPQLFP